MTWTIRNDLQSVTVGINHRLCLLKDQDMEAVLIHLGKEHSKLFWKERGVPFIPVGETKLISGDVAWNEEQQCWFYLTRPPVPMRFNDLKIVGITVDAVPMPPKTQKGKKKST